MCIPSHFCACVWITSEHCICELTRILKLYFTARKEDGSWNRVLKLSSCQVRRLKQFISCNLAVTCKSRLVQFASFCSLYFSQNGFGSCLLVLLIPCLREFNTYQRWSKLDSLLLNSVRLELRSASESIQPVLINLGRPKFEFDSAHVKYGVWTGP